MVPSATGGKVAQLGFRILVRVEINLARWICFLLHREVGCCQWGCARLGGESHRLSCRNHASQ
jgi:hypothetical protein